MVRPGRDGRAVILPGMLAWGGGGERVSAEKSRSESLELLSA